MQARNTNQKYQLQSRRYNYVINIYFINNNRYNNIVEIFIHQNTFRNEI